MENKASYKTVTLTKLLNQLKGDNQLVSTQFIYDNLDEVFEVTLYDTIGITSGVLDVPLRVYPTEVQRDTTTLIGSILSTEEVAFIHHSLDDTDYLDVLLSLEKPDVQYRELTTPSGKLHQLKVTKLIGDKQDVTLTVIFNFSERQVLNAQSLYAKTSKPLTGSLLGQYLYDTFIGQLDRTPKLVVAHSKYTENRLYPSNTFSGITLVNNTLVIRGLGEATIGIDLLTAKGHVEITQTGYIITIEYENEEVIMIYV